LVALLAVAYAAPIEVQEDETQDAGLKEQLIDSLRKGLEQTMQQIRERADKHHQNAQDLIKKGAEYADRLKQLHADTGDKVKELIQNFRDRAGDRTKNLWQSIVERFLNKREKRQALSGIRDFLRTLRETAQAHLGDFSEWLKGHWSNAVEKAGNAKDRWAAIAREIRDHAGEMTKETAREAREALQPHREELGGLYNEVMDKLKAVLNRRGE